MAVMCCTSTSRLCALVIPIHVCHEQVEYMDVLRVFNISGGVLNTVITYGEGTVS